MIFFGYRFQILSPIFSCHWSLQPYGRSYNLWRKIQVAKNLGLVNSFMAELAARYPKVSKPVNERPLIAHELKILYRLYRNASNHPIVLFLVLKNSKMMHKVYMM
jgi:hypothetical protein